MPSLLYIKILPYTVQRTYIDNMSMTPLNIFQRYMIIMPSPTCIKYQLNFLSSSHCRSIYFTLVCSAISSNMRFKLYKIDFQKLVNQFLIVSAVDVCCPVVKPRTKKLNRDPIYVHGNVWHTITRKYADFIVN